MTTAAIEYKGKKSEIEVIETREKMVFGRARFEALVPELVKLVMNRKDAEIRLLRQGLKAVTA